MLTRPPQRSRDSHDVFPVFSPFSGFQNVYNLRTFGGPSENKASFGHHKTNRVYAEHDSQSMMLTALAQRSLTEKRLVLVVAAARTALCTWRAAHQSITIDEATTYRFYVAAPWPSLYRHYIPNDHLLNSVLARLSVSLLGPSELALRLPSVIAGFFFTLGVFVVLRSSVARLLIRWLAFAAIALQPLLLDFSIAARGYGMGLTLLAWAMYFCLERRFRLTALLLGLAVVAQLSMAIPAVAIVAAAILLMRKNPPTPRLALGVCVAAIGMCVAALRVLAMREFNVGYLTLRESLYSLVFPSTTNREGLFVNAHTPAVFAEMAVVLAIAGFIVLQTARLLWRDRSMKRLAPVALLISAATLFAARGVGFKYPVDRTGLYLILLFALSWPVAVDALRSRAYRGLHIVLACAFVVQFCAQFDLHSFKLWRFDSDIRHVALIIARESAGKPANSMTVSAALIHRRSLQYYRQTLPIPALRPIQSVDPPPMSGYDFYVLNPGAHDPRPDAAHFRVLFSGPDSGIILAVPR